MSTNGERLTRKSGQGSRRSRETNAAPAEPPPAIDAPFAATDLEPIDAPMWPIQPGQWFQPDLAPTVPLWSGLAIERLHRVPTPDFLGSDILPVDRLSALDDSHASLRANAVPPRLPPSDLAPLGWDPRVLAPKEESQ